MRDAAPATTPRHPRGETLDRLAADAPGAMRSRRDPRRINRMMGSAGIIVRAMSRSRRKPERIIELGGGDGSLMLALARRLSPAWPRVRLSLLDRQPLVTSRTHAEFERLGWRLEVLCADVHDWAAQARARPQAPAQHWDICVANLFIHRFDSGQIAALFDALGRRTDMFVACEPRRGQMPLLASRLVGLLGANAVTREDAVASVRAGFRDRELSRLWPDRASEWRLEEGPAGWFSHRLIATRRRA